MRRLSCLFLGLVLVAACEGGAGSTTTGPVEGEVDFQRFAAELEYLRQSLRIPGMSAAVVRDQELVWAQGFGRADLANDVPATASTPYLLASVTKPIAATLMMQLVEEGLLDLDDPIADYGVDDLLAAGEIRVRHLLTHTSEGVPGTTHNYNGSRYARLGEVVEGAAGRPFAEELSERILEPLGMTSTAPNYVACGELGTAGERETRWDEVRSGMARPYQLDTSYEVVDGGYVTHFSPAAGLISTVVDLAAFDAALDDDWLLTPETKAQMVAAAIPVQSSRAELGYGLGWYVQDHEGTRLLWHSGRQPPSESALYLKVPDQDLTFILLANTPNLTTPFPLGGGDVMYSTPALAFWEEFVFRRLHGVAVPDIDWEAPAADLIGRLEHVGEPAVRAFLERELWSYRMLFHSVGRADLVDRLAGVHRQVYPESPGLSDYLASAAEAPPAGERVDLTPAERERMVGSYVLDEERSDWPASLGEAPPRFEVTLHGRELVVCANAEDAAMVMIPIGPTRFRAVGGPSGYLYFDVELEGQLPTAVWVTLGDLGQLVYVPAP